MSADTILGNDGCSSDEITTTYLLRGGRLVARCEYDRREREVDPADALAELDYRAGVSREMAEICAGQAGGAGDYPDRARAAESAARAIRAAFGPGA